MLSGHFYRRFDHIISRLITQKIKEATKSILLLGPRQTGKSTLLASLKPDLIINLARENEFLRYSSSIDLFSDQIESSSAQIVFIDEIQRIPSLLNTIQAIIDESKDKRAIRFLLSSSSARKLRRSHANLLPEGSSLINWVGFAQKKLDTRSIIIMR